MKFILKTFIRKIVTNEVPFKHNSQTAPAFIISDERNFDAEKKRLIDYVSKTLQMGEQYFDNKESMSFGKLSAIEWNNMFYKHLNHHLKLKQNLKRQRAKIRKRVATNDFFAVEDGASRIRHVIAFGAWIGLLGL